MFTAKQINYDEVGNKEAQMFADTYAGIKLHFGDISLSEYRKRFETSKDCGLTGLYHDDHGLVAILKYGKALKKKTAYTTDIMKINYSDDTGWLIKEEAQSVLLEHSRSQGYDIVVICGISVPQQPILSATLNALDITESVTSQSRGAFVDVAVKLNTGI